VKTNHVKVVG